MNKKGQHTLSFFINQEVKFKANKSLKAPYFVIYFQNINNQDFEVQLFQRQSYPKRPKMF